MRLWLPKNVRLTGRAPGLFIYFVHSTNLALWTSHWIYDAVSKPCAAAQGDKCLLNSVTRRVCILNPMKHRLERDTPRSLPFVACSQLGEGGSCPHLPGLKGQRLQWQNLWYVQMVPTSCSARLRCATCDESTTGFFTSHAGLSKKVAKFGRPALPFFSFVPRMHRELRRFFSSPKRERRRSG